MNYSTFERAFRKAVVNTLGNGSRDFDKWISTNNPSEDMDFEGLPMSEVSIELAFEPSISPFKFFSGNINMCADFDQGEGMLQVFFGEGCSNAARANEYADRFNYLSSITNSSWYVEDEIEETFGLHLVANFKYPNQESSEKIFCEMVRFQIELLLTVLTEDTLANELRSFIHYFEN
jgi:hypothetical protein